jgi:nicotinamidase-related amidase
MLGAAFDDSTEEVHTLAGTYMGDKPDDEHEHHNALKEEIENIYICGAAAAECVSCSL